jgi:DNA primase small subunit
MDIMSQAFAEIILGDQNCFSSEEGCKELLHLIPKNYVDDVQRRWDDNKDKSSKARWKDIAKVRSSLKPAGSSAYVRNKCSRSTQILTKAT